MNRACPSLWSSIPGAWVASGMQAWAEASARAPEPVMPNCWIFVASSLSNLDAWLAPLQGEVVHLDPSRDGLQQMAEWLHGSQGVQAVHILSHRAPGQLALGTLVADATGLCDEHAEPLAIIAGVLSADAVLTLHGRARGLTPDASDEKLIATLAAVTGARVRVQDGVPVRDGSALEPLPVHAAVRSEDDGEWLVAEAQVRAALLSAFQGTTRAPAHLSGPLKAQTPTCAALDEPFAETSCGMPLAHC